MTQADPEIDGSARFFSGLLDPGSQADLCFVFVRREQIELTLPVLQNSPAIGRFVFMVNHANGSQFLFEALGRNRVVLGFPGAGGCIESGVDRYIDIREQPTAIEDTARDIESLLRAARFRTRLVADMDAWLKRHAVMVTAIAGALCERGGDARAASSDTALMRTMILGVREGWTALDQLHVGQPPLALRSIFQWVPLPFAVMYWSHMISSARGEYYFARHVRRAGAEMRALAEDIRALFPVDALPHLRRLYAALEQRQA